MQRKKMTKIIVIAVLLINFTVLGFTQEVERHASIVDIEGKAEDAEQLGVALAEDVLSKGAKEILDEVYGR